MSQNHQSGFYAHPQQPQNVYQQMGIPQPQPHLNFGMSMQRPPTRPVVSQPIRYSASNPPTSSFPNQQRPQQVVQPVVQQRQPLLRPLPALLPSSKPPLAPTPSTSSRPLPTPGKRATIDLPLNSSSQIISSSPPKRRQSPPKFISDPGSESNSPIKQSFPSNREISTTKPTATPASASITTSLASSSPPKPSTTVSPSSSSSTSKPITTDVQPPKKSTPVWKRTIPEIPAPVWGYAAGLVADPHPKLSKQPPPPLPPSQVQVQTGAPIPESPTKSTGVPNKLKKKNKTKEKDGLIDEEKKVNNKTKDQISAVHGNAYGLGYSARQAQEQRYSGYKSGAQQGQYSSSRINAVNSGRLRKGEQDDGDEETEDGESVATEEEETEDGEPEEETGEEDDESDSVPTLRKFEHGNGHRRYYSQPLANERSAGASRAGAHRREGGYHGTDYDYEEDEDEDTPKKRKLPPGGSSKLPERVVEKKILLRPKVKVDPYDGYEDVTPIGRGARKPIRPRSEMDMMSGTPRNGKIYRRSEDESDDFVRKGKGNEGPQHRRPRSAIEEREMLILNARRNRRMREVESDYGAEEIRLAYDDEDGDYEGEVTVNDRRRRRGQEELTYRPQSQPNSSPSSRLVGGGRATAAGLPRPPAMIRDRDGGGFIQHIQAERKIQGGPRSAFVQTVNEEELERNHDEERGVNSWPGDLPRLPRTPGDGGDIRRGYFDSARNDSDLNLDEPPPPASIVRTPSPGVAGGYVLQKREIESHNRSQSAGFEQSQHRRFEALDEGHQRTQGQGRIYASRLGYPSQPESQSQVPQQRRQQAHGPVHPPQQGRYTTTPSPRKQQQTPAPPRPMGIESPYPVGGRDRMADMNKLERGEREAEVEIGKLQGRRIADVRNVPKVMVMGDNEGMVSPRRDIPPKVTVSVEPDRRPLPMPSSPRSRPDSHPQSMVMAHSFGVSPKKQTSPAQAPVQRDTPVSRSSTGDHNSNTNNNDVPAIQVFDVPGVYVSKPGFDDDCDGGLMINISGPEDQNQQRRSVQPQPPSHSQYTATPSIHAGPSHPAHGTPTGGNNGRGLICGGCHGHITHGRILSAMGLRWHPPCFKCNICSTLLEHVSSYENDGKAYCHLDYHETFAPRCYSCETAIIDEQFISLDDPALGKRTYHTQHFFCSECGDPFLDPSIPLSTDANGELALSGDGEFEGFTVYKGYPYCEACHVRLRLPKCKRCKKAIRDHEEAVEALGGKWCWACFVCAGCSQPFEDPSFFQRGNQPYCESCFSIMVRNEI